MLGVNCQVGGVWTALCEQVSVQEYVCGRAGGRAGGRVGVGMCGYVWVSVCVVCFTFYFLRFM